jgi:hypothetical protein
MKLHASDTHAKVRTVTMHDLGRFTLRTLPMIVMYLAFGSGVVAAPETFNAGDTLSASKINANFKESNDRLTKLEKQINGNAKYASGAVFCKATLGATPGDMSGLGGAKGYAGAKAACQVTCDNSATAHMCTSEELLRSVSMGIPLKEGWYASGVYGSGADCAGFSYAGSGSGPYWYVPPQPGPNQFEQPSSSTCSANRAVLCCDAPK